MDTVRPDFPDCAARRRLGRGSRLWRPVLLEFEYRSSGFQRDRHDPEGCDLIVRWIHDWLDCPVPVLELRSEIRRLEW